MPKKILIAEDEKPMAQALVLKLENEGFAAKAVFNGEEAIVALKAEQFDLMLLDIMMPKLDGFGVLEKMKTDNIKIPVIITSNLSQKEDIDRATGLGAVGFVIKSDTPIAEIVKNVKEALNT